MSELRILLPSFIRTDCDGYSKLAEIYGLVMKQSCTDVIIDFGACLEFESNMAAVLGSILQDLMCRGYNIFVTFPKAISVRRNLSRCKFLKAFDVKSLSMEKENYLEYKMFSRAESDNFKFYVRDQLMTKQKFPAHSEMAGILIQESILEIFVNAREHGECNEIFCCGEYFGKYYPPVLNMTIVDRGNTIWRTVNKFLYRKNNITLDQWEAISWAMKKGNTTKSFPGGLGLSRLKNFIKVNQGSLQIVSDIAMIEFSNGMEKRSQLNMPFEGTIVTMKFNFNENQKYYRAKEEALDINNLL